MLVRLMDTNIKKEESVKITHVQNEYSFGTLYYITKALQGHLLRKVCIIHTDHYLKRKALRSDSENFDAIRIGGGTLKSTRIINKYFVKGEKFFY